MQFPFESHWMLPDSQPLHPAARMGTTKSGRAPNKNASGPRVELALEAARRPRVDWASMMKNLQRELESEREDSNPPKLFGSKHRAYHLPKVGAPLSKPRKARR